MPPPGPAPVVVVKDVGGLVTDYQRQTEAYRQEGREVRLHECRSACTMALSLPNVCVYPDSVLRFHQAYNRDTKEVDIRVSDQLFSTYPESVRRRLGYLTRAYKSLSGAELINLGVRNCNETPVMFARRKQGGTQVASAAPVTPEEPGAFSRLAGRLSAALTGKAEPAASMPSAARPQTPASPPVQVARADERPAPLPPVRPANLTPVLTDPTPVGSISPEADEEIPVPPIRPARLNGAPVQVAKVAKPQVYKLQARLPDIITGAWPVLPPSFSAYAPLR